MHFGSRGNKDRCLEISDLSSTGIEVRCLEKLDHLYLVLNLVLKIFLYESVSRNFSFRLLHYPPGVTGSLLSIMTEKFNIFMWKLKFAVI